MKKKSLLAIMLIALVLTLGVMVSCQPDPDPDELEGTWKYSEGGILTTINSDGFGNYSITRSIAGVDFYNETGTYSLDNGIVTLNGSIPATATQTNPKYVFVYYDGGEDEYYLLIADDEGPHAYPGSGDYEYDGPYELTGGTTYTMDESATYAGKTYKNREVYTVGAGSISFSMTMSVKEDTALLYSHDIAGSATSVTGGTMAPDPYLYFYNDTYSNYITKSKYSVNGNTLSIYMGGTQAEFTKQ